MYCSLLTILSLKCFLIFNALKFSKWKLIWPWHLLRQERHTTSVCQGDISERPILSFMIRFLPELRNFWKEKYENFNVFDFSFSKVYQKIRKLFYYSMQRPDLSLQNKIYKDWKISTNLNLWWTSICSKYWRFLPLLGSLLDKNFVASEASSPGFNLEMCKI